MIASMGISRSVKLMKKGGKAAYKPGYAHVAMRKLCAEVARYLALKAPQITLFSK
jgi:hypothetical protein